MPKNIQNKIRRPTAIKLLASLCIVCGFVLMVILAVGLYSLPNLSINLNAITIAIIGIVSIVLGYGILSADARSFILSLALIIVLALVQLVQILMGRLSGIFGIIVCVLVVYCLMRKDVKRLLGVRH